MNKEILYVVDAVSNEKNVGKSLIFEAVETALAMATRKRFGMHMDVRVAVNRNTGDYDTYRRWLVVDDEDPNFESPERQILLSYAQNRGLSAQVGEYIEEKTLHVKPYDKALASVLWHFEINNLIPDTECVKAILKTLQNEEGNIAFETTIGVELISWKK